MPDPTSPYPPDYHLAWAYLIGWIRNAEKHDERLDPTRLLDLMQELHERYGLPPEDAPKRGTG